MCLTPRQVWFLACVIGLGFLFGCAPTNFRPITVSFVQGVAYYPNGQPVSRAKVTYGPVDSMAVFSDTLGRFLISGVIIGDTLRLHGTDAYNGRPHFATFSGDTMVVVQSQGTHLDFALWHMTIW